MFRNHSKFEIKKLLYLSLGIATIWNLLMIAAAEEDGAEIANSPSSNVTNLGVIFTSATQILGIVGVAFNHTNFQSADSEQKILRVISIEETANAAYPLSDQKEDRKFLAKNLMR
jgi:hypothetical protein